nr:chaperone modulator CbpM [Flavobacterium nitratireducens]
MQYVHKESIYEIEKIVRMHKELQVNIEGIDVVLNLLQKIDALQAELLRVRNRLLLYEN